MASTFFYIKSSKMPKATQSFFKSHLGLVLCMVCITMMWSTAGVMTRQVLSATGRDITFWRSFFTATVVGAYWVFTSGVKGVVTELRAGWLLWASAMCWACMFTCFMLAMSYTTLGHVLLVLSVGPFLTALFGRIFFKQHIYFHTWLAVIFAGLGLAYMFSQDLSTRHGQAVIGLLIAGCVPIAGAFNFLILQHSNTKKVHINLMPAVCLGAVLSALICLPAVRFSTTLPIDFVWLLSLGVFQLAIPCVWVVWVSARLPAAEVSLLAVLEVIFGICLAWIWGGETPSNATLMGGSLVICVLILHATWRIYMNQQKLGLTDFK